MQKVACIEAKKGKILHPKKSEDKKIVIKKYKYGKKLITRKLLKIHYITSHRSCN